MNRTLLIIALGNRAISKPTNSRFFAFGERMKIILELDPAAYAVEAVQKAAYQLIDRLVVVVSTQNDSISCEIESISGQEQDLDASVQDFKRELIDQQLRLKIKAETEDVRNLILAYTFSRSGLQG